MGELVDELEALGYVMRRPDPEDRRAKLIMPAAQALDVSGKLIVREMDPAKRGGAHLARLIERVMTALGWNRGRRVRFRPIEDLKADLQALGFQVSVADVSGEIQPGSVLLVAERH